MQDLFERGSEFGSPNDRVEIWWKRRAARSDRFELTLHLFPRLELAFVVDATLGQIGIEPLQRLAGVFAGVAGLVVAEFVSKMLHKCAQRMCPFRLVTGRRFSIAFPDL